MNLNDLQSRALKKLENANRHSKKLNVSSDMAWVYPRQFRMRVATFQFLVRAGLAHQRISPYSSDLQFKIATKKQHGRAGRGQETIDPQCKKCGGKGEIPHPIYVRRMTSCSMCNLSGHHGGAGRGQGRKPVEGGYTHKLQVHITEDDAKLLDELCEQCDSNRSYTVRKLIREAAAVELPQRSVDR